MQRLIAALAATLLLAQPAVAQSVGGAEIGMSGTGSAKQLKVRTGVGGAYAPIATIDGIAGTAKADPGFLNGVTVGITGGAIDGTALGGITPAAGAFTTVTTPTLQAPGPQVFKSNGTEFLRGFDAGGGRPRVWGNFVPLSDAAAQTWLNNGQFVIASHGFNNAVIGYVANDLPTNTLAFPTGLTGIAYVNAAGNTAFAGYNEAHLTVPNGVAVAHEVAVFADKLPSTAGYPLNQSIGTTQSVTVGQQVTAGTTNYTVTGATTSGSTTVTLSSVANLFVGDEVEGNGIPFGSFIVTLGASSAVLNNPATATATGVSLRVFATASVGQQLGREGSSFGMFNYGYAASAGSVRDYFLFSESQGTVGPSNGAYLAYNGLGTGLIVRPTVSYPTRLSVAFQDGTGANVWGVQQNGQMVLNSPTSNVVGVAGAAQVLPANPTGYLFVTISGSQKRVAYYE